MKIATGKEPDATQNNFEKYIKLHAVLFGILNDFIQLRSM